MRDKKRFYFVILSVVGALLLLLGGFVFTSENAKMISGLFIGFGSAMLVLGIGNVIGSFIVLAVEDEKIKHDKMIEVNDERNTRIREKTGYMVSKTMNYIICALVLALGFINADKVVIILVASLLLIELTLVIAFSNYYSKQI